LQYVIRVTCFVCLVVLLFPSSAFAYLDPGTGSFITQIIIALLLGMGVALKIFWSRIMGIFQTRKSSPPKELTDDREFDQDV
jgi:hypothetical protein